MEFVQGSTVPFEEDKDYEFKMHLDLCEDDLPAWLQTGACCGKRTRRAISKTINAFLNAGKGGTILLGIADDGEIKGFSLSLQQKDHIYVAIEDLMSRYLPPVPSHLYKLNYIPVMDGNQKIVSNWNPPHPTNCSASRAHLVRSNKRCWCFNNATLATYKGKGFSRYVAELTLSPTLPICKPHLPPLKPLFCDEEGDCYIRKCASVWQISYSEVIQMTREEVNHYLRGKGK